MLGQTEALEQAERIRREHLGRGLARVKGKKERDEPAHDVSVAVAAPMQDGLGPRGFDALLEPDLTGAP